MAKEKQDQVQFDFYGDLIRFEKPQTFSESLPPEISAANFIDFLKKLDSTDYSKCVDALLTYKKNNSPDDWLYYQLVRTTAAWISPKSENYYRYTLYKYFLMSKSGYDVKLFLSNEKLLFYVQCDENIYNIPFRTERNRQYVCLNFHDYKNLQLNQEHFSELYAGETEAIHGFSYKISKLPEFKPADYVEKEINFNYYQQENHFKIKLNNQVKDIFANYPVVDYSSYFNTPLSKETYQSLIPALKKQMSGMTTKSGVEYLMRFTRYAFSFESDTKNFGDEKRLTPEQTLLYDKSDCEDRVALFFYLVKEIYNLPMIVLSYPKHITIAVQLNRPVGRTINYNGAHYSICEPTPQKEDLAVGQLMPELKKESFEIVYAYQPVKR